MITITFAGWMIPAAITVIGLIWALFIVDDRSNAFIGVASGLSNVFALIPVSIVSAIAWIVWAIFK